MTCLCADGNHPVESEELIMQEKIGERIVTWKPPKELLQLFRLFTPGILYPSRDIHYTVMILSCQMIASSPIGSLSPIISISVSSVVVYYPSTQGTAAPGHLFSKYGTLNHFLCFPLLHREDHEKAELGSMTLVHEAIQTDSILRHQGHVETNWD